MSTSRSGCAGRRVFSGSLHGKTMGASTPDMDVLDTLRSGRREALDVTTRAVQPDWATARMLLRRALSS